MFDIFKFFKKNKEEIEYIDYSLDRGWCSWAKSVLEDKENKYPKYEYENILEDLLSYKEEIKDNTKLKQVMIEEIGDINIFIQKVKERIDNYGL